MFKKSILTALLVMVTVVAAHAEKTAIDPKIKKYAPAAGVAGRRGLPVPASSRTCKRCCLTSMKASMLWTAGDLPCCTTRRRG